MADGASRRGFAVVVVAGLAAAGLAVLASGRAWVTAELESGDADWAMAFGAAGAGGQAPLATALAPLLLAVWGLVLVTRGRFRRTAAWLLPVTAVALLAATLWGARSAADSLRADLEDLGHVEVNLDLTGWFWCAVLAAVLAVPLCLIAARSAPGWPEMGGRYDAPGGDQAPAPAAAEDGSNLDLWKAMDAGRDPTADP